jgi:hypothetical protein
MGEAREIYQENLDAVSRSVWNRDWDAVEARLAIPNEIILQDGRAELSDAAAIRRHLAVYRDGLDAQGANGYHRFCVEASFRGTHRIVGRHRTFVLSGTRRLVKPYDSRMGLSLFGETWKAAWLMVEVENAVLAVVPSEDLSKDEGWMGRAS